MIIVDTALKARHEAGNPLKVGMVGAGAMGWGIATQIVNFTLGMELVAVSSRTLKSARKAYAEAGIDDPIEVKTLFQLEDAIRRGKPAVTENASLLCQAEGIDIIAEVTGTIEFAAGVVLEAINHQKPVVMMNAELDGTIGPILKHYADRQGVILSGCEGDQPGVEMNLYRFVKTLGLQPLVCGNVKGMLDPYRTPATQAEFAKRWNQTPHMVTSFADGTKIAFEQAIVANATGMVVAQRGMIGHSVKHVDELVNVYDVDQLKRLGGIVDYVLGAEPGPGVYVIGYTEDPTQRHYFQYLKRGEGPLYSFYTPYHLCCVEFPISIARVGLLNDPVIAPIAGPVVDVITTAKRDLEAGETLDGIGHYMTYGQCENSDVVRKKRLLPMGLSEGCRLKRAIPKDQVLTYDDVELPEGQLCHKLRAEQDAIFAPQRQLATVG
ncbi:MAG: NAD(P)-dependent oxidoreductase [Cyanobacteria bacterium]|nr:NAD(P)-dependent oxidoreductase [Cyanobacteriota bacterium]MDW8201016.1 NAD(P)-dependent oxidoreductase [Cyanobacteriota bacterium SKYGB_h_bin112]